jgi:hypothetical protein
MVEVEDVRSEYAGEIASIDGKTLSRALEIAKRHRINYELAYAAALDAANDMLEYYKKRVEYLESKKES